MVYTVSLTCGILTKALLVDTPRSVDLLQEMV